MIFPVPNLKFTKNKIERGQDNEEEDGEEMEKTANCNGAMHKNFIYTIQWIIRTIASFKIVFQIQKLCKGSKEKSISTYTDHE